MLLFFPTTWQCGPPHVLKWCYGAAVVLCTPVRCCWHGIGHLKNDPYTFGSTLIIALICNIPFFEKFHAVNQLRLPNTCDKCINCFDSYWGWYISTQFCWYIIFSKNYNIIEFFFKDFFWYKFCIKWIYTRQVMTIWSLRGLVILQCNEYKLCVLQEAAIGGCNSEYNGVGGYNIAGYTMVAYSTLCKHLCWESGVSHKLYLHYIWGPLVI